MTKLIKSAIVYKAELPSDIEAIRTHLAEKAFTPILEAQAKTFGFVDVDHEHDLLATFHGGLAFRVRIDEKVIPGSLVRQEVAKAVDLVSKAQGRKVGKKEKAEIKEAVIYDLTCRALPRTAASITCFYHQPTGYLIIPTTSKKIADVCTHLLVQAIGSVKTETIHVSEVKNGLTTRLQNWLAHQTGEHSEGEAFGPLHPCDEVAMASSEGRKLSIKMGSLDSAQNALKEAFRQGFKVTSLGFHHDGTDFRLSHDFRLRGVDFASTVEEGSEDDPALEAEASLQIAAVTAIVDILVEMLRYKEDPATEQAAGQEGGEA